MADSAASEITRTQNRRGGGRASILIVEDDAAMREMLREALEDDGYSVETAVNGRAGVERVQ